MITDILKFSTFVVFLTLACAAKGQAQGLLDGKSYAGMMGPAESPDLSDRLYFNKGYFWSDICSRCGFVPGPYQAEETADGIAFSGSLASENRGQFDYQGMVAKNGEIVVAITWQRRRWYWTSTRQTIFTGHPQSTLQFASLAHVQQKMRTYNPDRDPACAGL